jgi:hypothetical protein
MKMDKDDIIYAERDDIIYAERFLEILKKSKTSLSAQLYEKVHREYKEQLIKQHQNYDHILRELERLGLIEIEHLNKSVKKIYLLEKALLATSFKEEQAKWIAIQEKKAKRENLEFEHLKLQVWTSKNWPWITFGTAVITAVVTIYFFQCP